jgi:hypothetical protein
MRRADVRAELWPERDDFPDAEYLERIGNMNDLRRRSPRPWSPST